MVVTEYNRHQLWMLFIIHLMSLEGSDTSVLVRSVIPYHTSAH